MTIAHLLVKLGAETAEFHQQMERAARRTERTGRVFTKIGREISQAISLPLIAGAFGAFHLLLIESTRHFGGLFQAVESLKGELRGLFLALAHELEPIFLQIIGLLRSGIGILRGWITAFHELPEPVRRAVIFTLAFLAALGPTLFVVGKLITAIGALGRILPLLVTPMGLAVAAVVALAAAALFVVTHWEQTKLRFALLWAGIKLLFFDGIRSILGGLALLLQAGADIATAYSGMPGPMGAAFRLMAAAMAPAAEGLQALETRFEAFAARSLAESIAQIKKLEAELKTAQGPMQGFTNQANAIQRALEELAGAMRRTHGMAQVLGPTFNLAAAQAQHIQGTIQTLIDQGVDPLSPAMRRLGEDFLTTTEDARAFSVALDALGPRLDQRLRAMALFDELKGVGIAPGFSAEAVVAEGKIIQAQMEFLLDALSAVAERIGEIFAGVRQGFRGFAAQMGVLLGGVTKMIGETLVKMGLAAVAASKLGFAIKFFARNPLASMAAGLALIALGSALAASSQRTLEQGFSGGGGGGASVESSASSASSPAGGNVYVTFPTGQVFNPADLAQQEAFREFLENLLGRDVIILPPAGA